MHASPLLGGNPALQLPYFIELDLSVVENRLLAKEALQNVIHELRLIPRDRRRAQSVFSPTRKAGRRLAASGSAQMRTSRAGTALHKVEAASSRHLSWYL